MLSEKLNSDFGMLSTKIVEVVKANYLLLILVLLNFSLFLLNYPLGKYYAIADIPLFELNPGNELWRRLFLWQEQRGFGLEFGQDIGLTGLLSGLTLLSSFGLSPVSVTYIYNMILFILPAIAVFFLAFAFFYDNKHRNQIAFFAGLFGNLNFYIYITGNHPLFLRKFPGIMIAFLLGAVILVLKTRKKRYWGLFGLFSLLNLASFDAPAFFVLGAFLIFLYILFHLIFESKNFRRDLFVIAGLAAIFFSISASGIVANFHLLLYSDFLNSPQFSQYTASLFQLNQLGLDNSELFNSFRLIGTVNWGSSIPEWKGALVYPYYTIFTTNPVFILASFLLPVLAFGVLVLKTDSSTKHRLVFLTFSSLLFLFLIKGVNKPFGEVFLWAMKNIPLFMIFRQPYDKAGIVLVLTMSLAAGYGLTRIFHLILEKGSRKILKIGVVTLLVSSLVINAYPALTGDVYDRTAFFELPQAYYDLSNKVNAYEELYKVAVLPELAYSNQLSWGYYGIGLHSWSLNKPVLVRSFTGSDIFSETMTKSILHEVEFFSGGHYPHNIYNEQAAILPNTNTSENTVNYQRINYFTYLLQKSNVGKIVFRNDYKGIGSVDIKDVDFERYQLLFDAMKKSSGTDVDENFGELTLYSVQNWMPLIYSSSKTDSYSIREYDNFLDTYYTNARFAVIASLFDYDVSKEFIQTEGKLEFLSSIYVPLIIEEYFHKINGDLNIAKAQLTQEVSKINLLEEKVSNLLNYQSLGWTNLDYIESPGTYDVYLKIPPPPPPTPTSQTIDLIGEIINAAKAEVNNENLVLDSYVDQIENALQSSNVSELAEMISVPYVSNLRIAVTNRDRNAIIDRLRDLQIKISYESTETVEEITGKELVFSTNGEIGSLILNLTQINDYWYHTGSLYLENGAFLSRKDFLINSEMVLVRQNESSTELTPKVTFYQINPVKFRILFEDVSTDFFLNFLESYSKSWKLYPTQNSGFGRRVVSEGLYAVQLDSEKTWFEGSDLTRLSSNGLFEEDHYLLNGFANSWYIDLEKLVLSGYANPNSDGTYTIAFELYYMPQTYLSLTILIGILTIFITYVIIFSKRIREKITIPLQYAYLFIKRKVIKIGKKWTQ